MLTVEKFLAMKLREVGRVGKCKEEEGDWCGAKALSQMPVCGLTYEARL